MQTALSARPALVRWWCRTSLSRHATRGSEEAPRCAPPLPRRVPLERACDRLKALTAAVCCAVLATSVSLPPSRTRRAGGCRESQAMRLLERVAECVGTSAPSARTHAHNTKHTHTKRTAALAEAACVCLRRGPPLSTTTPSPPRQPAHSRATHTQTRTHNHHNDRPARPAWPPGRPPPPPPPRPAAPPPRPRAPWTLTGPTPTR